MRLFNPDGKKEEDERKGWAKPEEKNKAVENTQEESNQENKEENQNPEETEQTI